VNPHDDIYLLSQIDIIVWIHVTLSALKIHRVFLCPCQANANIESVLYSPTAISW